MTESYPVSISVRKTGNEHHLSAVVSYGDAGSQTFTVRIASSDILKAVSGSTVTGTLEVSIVRSAT